MSDYVYLNKPVPSGESNYTTITASWKGLNKAQFIDSGYMSDANNVYVGSDMYPQTAPKAETVISGYNEPISIHGFGDFLIVVYKSDDTIKADYIKGGRTWTGTVNSDASDTSPRCIIQFNVYTTPNDPISGTFDKKLIIYPDKVSMDYSMNDGAGVTTFDTASIDVGSNVTPNLKYACVYLSRVFGLDDDRIYASGFNDYTNWDLDTADDDSSSNAWVSTAQSNVKAGNDFTGIIVFNGTVVAFKSDFMHEIYNNKNPFRVGDIYAEGAIDNRSLQDVDGNLLFVSSDNVKQYTGGNPNKIGTPLGISHFNSGIAGSYGSDYCLFLDGDNKTATYNVDNGMWSIADSESDIVGYASNENGIYSFGTDGAVRKLNTSDYSHSWYIETDLSLCSTLDIKRLKSLQIMVDIGVGANIKAYALTENETFNASSSQLLFDSGDKTGRNILRCAIRQTAGWSHKIRFCGTGYVKLYVMQLRYAIGGVRYDN